MRFFKKHPLLLACLFILLMYIFRIPLSHFIGAAVISEDAVTHTDVIFVLNGAFPRSSLGALQLYEQLSQKPWVVFAREREWDNMQEFRQKGGTFPSAHTIQETALFQLGIPKHHVMILPEVCDTTEAEAHALKKYLLENSQIHHITLVTRRSHTRRAKMIFELILGPKYPLSAHAFDQDPLHKNTWTQDPWHIYEVTMEVLKYYKTLLPWLWYKLKT